MAQVAPQEEELDFSLHTFPCEVRQIQRLTPKSVLVTLDPGVERSRFQHQPGQRLTFCLNVGDRTCYRSYNLVNAPDTLPQVAVKRVTDGGAAQWFNEDLRVGDTLMVAPPEGEVYPATLDDAGHHFLLFAAGSGITPLFSILRHALHARSDHKVTLFYSNRSTRDIMFRQELDELASSSRLNVFHILGDGGTGDDLSSGRLNPKKVSQLLEQFRTDHGPEHAFVSGPVGFQQTINTAISGAYPRLPLTGYSFGVQPHCHPDEAGHPQKTSTIIILKKGEEKRLEGAPKHMTLLEAADQSGIDMPADCRGGICHRCKAKLVAGRTTSMPASQGKRTPPVGYILCCQERPASDEVVLEFDEATD